MNDEEPVIGDDFFKTLSVLYVEDEGEVREALSHFLRRRFARLDTAENGRRGLELFRSGRYDVVITDVKMPVMDGLEMARQIKQMAEETPVIVVTAYNETNYLLRAIDVGVDRYVKKPVDPNALIDAVYRATRAHFHRREMEKAKQKAVNALTSMVTALARAIEKRDPYTDGHQKRVSRLAVAIAQAMGLGQDQIDGVRLGALIHDVGKLSVPIEILVMPRSLNDQEFGLVVSHPQAGTDILGDIDFPWPLVNIIMQHHERLDGSGYPIGLKGDQIALEARIVAVADVVEAMSSHRPYRGSLGVDAAIEEITANRGRLYDERVVDCCVEILKRGGGLE